MTRPCAEPQIHVIKTYTELMEVEIVEVGVTGPQHLDPSEDTAGMIVCAWM